jgi:Tol biopolymer transport system component
VSDVFVRDRLLGTTTRVSASTTGGDAGGASAYPSISEDGRWIAFSSDAPNIVEDDTNGVEDVFLYDRLTGQISRISVAWDGGEGDGYSHTPSISGDGRYVAFGSGALNLVPGPVVGLGRLRSRPSGRRQRDRQLLVSGRAEAATAGTPISAGAAVAFISNSTNGRRRRQR